MSFRSLSASIKLTVVLGVLGLAVLGLALKMPSTGAFLSSVVRASNNLVTNGQFSTCQEGERWLYEVADFSQGTLKNGNPITDPARTDVNAVLGTADGQFFALGVGGSLTATFEHPILDQSGPDLDLTVNEATNGRNSYPEETALIEVSQDGSTWVALSVAASSKATGGINEIDIAETGFSWIQYIRFTDTTNYGPHAANADGFDLESVQAVYGVCDELPLDDRTLSGLKYHDANGNGQQDEGEAGLEGWNIYATTKIWESDVQALHTPAVESPVLESGTTYIARVTGTYDANDGIEADAQYSYRTPNSTEWTDEVKNYEGYGPTLLDLQIDGASPSWGEYNADHVYWIPLSGAGLTKSFEIYDLNNGSNNSGQLQVELFQVIESTTTDADGNYSLTVIGATNDTLYLFEGNQAGWQQTQPGSAAYYYQVEPGADEEQYPFGNQQLGDEQPQLAQVTVCKVDQSQQPLSGWQMMLYSPEAADQVTVYPSNNNGSSGGSANQVSTSTSLPLNDYLLIADGAYTYRNTAGATLTDATFSQRHPNDSVYGGPYAPWVNVMNLNNAGWLGVMVNGTPTNWSDMYNPAHRYALGYTDYSGSFNFTILDDVYSDNQGQIEVAIHQGWSQSTTDNGCTTFADVPYGEYQLDEIMQSGWQYQGGDLGAVTVDAETETFTLVNQPEALANLPSSYITVSNSPAKLIEDRITNGSFEANGGSFDNWNVSGDVTLLTGEEYADPQHGDHMVRVGKTTNEGNPASLNVVSQEIPAGVRSLGFYYNMFTYDVDGFDEPGFMVFVNDEMVFQRWANEIDQDDPLGDAVNLESTGWEYIGLDLSRYPDGTTLSLAFYAGNDIDNLPSDVPHQTWVYLDNFSTNEAVVNSESLFEIHTNEGDTAYYRIGTDPTVHQGNTFSINSQPDNQRIYYWSENEYATEATNSFHVLYDNVAPETIIDLEASHVENNLFDLTWNSPHDDNNFTDGSTNAAWYEIRYSTSPIDETTDWNTLSEVAIVTEDGLPGGSYRAPRPEDELETYQVRVFDVAESYYFAVKSYDAAGNVSDISNISQVSPEAEVVIDASSDVVLNEIMPELDWVELYNKSDQDIDVAGWVVYDEDDNAVIISSNNSDNDLDTEDDGETVVPANGMLVVYGQDVADFDLDQDETGDTVSLYTDTLANAGSLIDAHTYGGPVPDAKSIARLPDGVGEWVDPIPTAGRVNVETPEHLQPLVRIWQQESYNLKLGLFDAINYDQAEYTIEYDHTTHGDTTTEAILGSLTIDDQVEMDKNLYLATCSSGGVCIPHTGVTNFKVTVTLTGTGIPERRLTETLTGAWSE